MKANEAPDKIFVPTRFRLVDGLRIRESDIRESDMDVEYTRTDTFMKKAENFLEMLEYGFTITDNITHENYDKEKLIEDFKNYMEGE